MLRNSKVFFTLLLALLLAAVLLHVAGCSWEAAPDSEPENGIENETLGVVKITDRIILATTTSTYDSGLLDFLNPIFTEKTGIEVQVISQGTGAALETGARGDADVLLVHDREAELNLVEEGAFVDRFDVMYNDFIVVGPAEDPAGVNGVTSAVEAFRLIAAGSEIFVSRGDDSGTNRMELRLWESAGIEPEGQDWYLSVGQGMGDTLRVADESMGYTLTDRSTYVSIRDSVELVSVLAGDPALFNQYGVMAVNPKKQPHVKYNYAMLYIEFLMSDEGQNLINSFRVNGERLFFPGYGLK